MSDQPPSEQAQRTRAEAVRACQTCGRQFERSGRQRYCSRACRPSSYKLLEAKRTCRTCGREFERSRRQRYCSPPCRPSSYHPVQVKRPKGSNILQTGLEKRQRIHERRAEGWVLSKIAAEMGISKQRVQQLLSEDRPALAPR